MTYATVSDFHSKKTSKKSFSSFVQAFKSFMNAWCDKSRLYGPL